VRDQENLEVVAIDGVDGERRPVERDRTLDRDEFCAVFWRAEAEMRHAVEVAPRQNVGRAVDMAADHMAAEFVADAQRPLEIDQVGGHHILPQFSIGERPGEDRSFVTRHIRERCGTDALIGSM